MKVLVIPDVHLKYDMFKQAQNFMEAGVADKAVCLMDIADDWHMQFQIDAYIRAYEEAINFAIDFPDTLWCYGNHDLCYLWNERETGYSLYADRIVCEMLGKLKQTVKEQGSSIRYIQKIDNVLFLHGGLTETFVKENVPMEKQNNIEDALYTINMLGHYEMWNDDSPIWYRPQERREQLYKESQLLQVVGHTPVKGILKVGNVISCDTFSTYNNKTPIGSQEFLLIDTKTMEYCGIK